MRLLPTMEETLRTCAALEAAGETDASKLHHEKYRFDMKEIRAKARGASERSVGTKTFFLSHKAATAQGKMMREIDESHAEQVWNSHVELRAHIAQERDRVFVTREAWDRSLAKAAPGGKATENTNY